MNRDVRFHAQAGLTLPELLVVSVVLVTLLGLVESTFRYQAAAQRRESAKVTTQSDLRIWMDRMVRSIRAVGYDPRERNQTTPTFGFVALSSTEFRATSDYDGDGVLDSESRENIGFRLNGDVLELWRGGSSWRPVVDNVTSLQLSCFDSQKQSITCATSPASIRRSIAAIAVTITAHAETGGAPSVAPPVITQKATAELRNEIY